MSADDLIKAYESRLRDWNGIDDIKLIDDEEKKLNAAYRTKRKRDQLDKEYNSFRRKFFDDNKAQTPSRLRRELDDAYNEKQFENVRKRKSQARVVPQQPPALPPRPVRKVSVKISSVPQKPLAPPRESPQPPRERKVPAKTPVPPAHMKPPTPLPRDRNMPAEIHVPQQPPAPPAPPPRNVSAKTPPALPPRPNDFLNDLRKKFPKLTPKTRTLFLGKVLREKKRQHDPPRKVSKHNDRTPANASPPVPKPPVQKSAMGTIPEHNVESKPTGLVAWVKGLLKKNDAPKSTGNPQQKSTGNAAQISTGVPRSAEASKLDPPEMSAKREPMFQDKKISRARSTDRIKTELPPRASNRRRHSDMSKKKFGSASTKRFQEQVARRSSKHSGTEMPKKATLDVQDNFDEMNMYVRSIIVAREFYLKQTSYGLYSMEQNIIKELKSRQEELKLPDNSNPISEDKAKTDRRYMEFFRSHLTWAKKYRGIPNMMDLVEEGQKIEAQKQIPKGTPTPEIPPPAPPGRTPNEHQEDFDKVESEDAYIQHIYNAFIARPDYKHIVEDIKRIVSDIYSRGWQSFCTTENSQGVVQIAELENKLHTNSKVRKHRLFKNTLDLKDDIRYAEYCNLLTQEYATTDAFIGNRVGVNYDEYKRDQPPSVNSIGTFEKPFGQINGTFRNKHLDNHIKYDADIFVFNEDEKHIPPYLTKLIEDQILAYNNISQTLSKQHINVPPTPIFFAMLEKNEYKISLWGYDVARIKKPKSVPRERNSKTRRRMDSTTLQTLERNDGPQSLAHSAETLSAETLQAHRRGQTKRRTPVPQLQETSQETQEYIKNMQREVPVTREPAPETKSEFPRFIIESYTLEQLKCIDAARLNRELDIIKGYPGSTQEEEFKKLYPDFKALYEAFKSKSCLKKAYFDPLIDALIPDKQKKYAALQMKFPKLSGFTMKQLECLDEQKYKDYDNDHDDHKFNLKRPDFPTLYPLIGNGSCHKKAARVHQRALDAINKVAAGRIPVEP